MYLDLVDELHINKKLMKIVGIETTIYWAELVSILKQVVKKQTCDEKGFFKLDRAYVERETTLTPEIQAVCDQTLVHFDALMVDPNNPDRICIGVNRMMSLIADVDPAIMKQPLAKPKLSRKEQAEAKKNGMKFNMKNAVVEPDIDLKNAYDLWIDSMIDAANCRFTKAVVEVFVKTVRDYTKDKATQLRIIEIATTDTLREAAWAIDRLKRDSRPFGKPSAASQVKLPEQKVCDGVRDDVSF